MTKDSYFGVIEEIWEFDHGPLKIPLFRCQWVNRAGGGVTIDRYIMTIVDYKKIGYKDEPRQGCDAGFLCEGHGKQT